MNKNIDDYLKSINKTTNMRIPRYALNQLSFDDCGTCPAQDECNKTNDVCNEVTQKFLERFTVE